MKIHTAGGKGQSCPVLIISPIGSRHKAPPPAMCTGPKILQGPRSFCQLRTGKTWVITIQPQLVSTGEKLSFSYPITNARKVRDHCFKSFFPSTVHPHLSPFPLLSPQWWPGIEILGFLTYSWSSARIYMFLWETIGLRSTQCPSNSLHLWARKPETQEKGNSLLCFSSFHSS